MVYAASATLDIGTISVASVRHTLQLDRGLAAVADVRVAAMRADLTLMLEVRRRMAFQDD